MTATITQDRKYGDGLYLFRDRQSGELHEIELTFGELMDLGCLQIIERDGRELKRDQAEEDRCNGVTKAPRVVTRSESGWPKACFALGCGANEVPEHRAHLERHGISADFTANGDIVLNDRGHRRRVLQAYGMVDKDGGYGDTYNRATE